MSTSATGYKSAKWAAHLDKFCAVIGGFLPMGLVMGNVVFETTISLVCIVWVSRALLIWDNPIKGLIRHPFFLPWLAWYGSVLVSIGWNGPGSKGWGHDVVLIRYFIYVMALIDISERQPVVRYLLFGMVLSIIWGGVNILLANVIGYDVFGRPLSRYMFKLKDAGRIASLECYAGPFFIAWAAGDSGPSLRRRILLAAIGLIALLQIFYFHIRTAEVAALAGIYVYFLYLTGKSGKRRNQVLLLGGASVGLLLFLYFGPDIDLSSIYDRIGYWKVSWRMWQEHPIAGVSVSAWQDVYNQMVSSDMISPFISPDGHSWKTLDVTHAHNLFFHLISATGILGLMSFGWLLARVVRIILQKRGVCGNAFLTWPIVFLLIGITGWNIYGSQYQAIFAILMALTGSRMENFGFYLKEPATVIHP